MKRPTVHLYAFLLALLRYLSGALALLMLTAVAAAQAVNPFENNVYAFFSDPVMFSGVVLWVSTWLTEIITDALKDRSRIKGWHTRAIAAGTAAILAGVGGFFGLSYFTGVSGLSGAATAAGLALASWLGADVKHRASQLRKTGMRGDKRKAIQSANSVVLEGLILAGSIIPPPFNVAASVITNLYEKFGADVVTQLLDQQRALSQVEKSENQDAWEEGQRPTPSVSVRPSTPNPSPSEVRP